MIKFRSLRLAGALPVILVLAACSTGATPTPSTASAAPPSAAAPSEAAPSAAASDAASPTGSESGEAGESYAVKVAQGTVAGKTASFLTGEGDKTLYIFTPDVADSGKSACSGQCATNWPPFTVDDQSQLKPDAAATGAFAVISRDDGTKQVTYKGLPLYYYAADKAAGDTTGEGVADKWHVAAP